MIEKVKQIPKGEVDKMMENGREKDAEAKIRLIQAECEKFDQITGKSLSRLFADQMERCVDYAVDVYRYMKELEEMRKPGYDAKKYDQVNEKRTIAHNTVISNFTALVRNLRAEGLDISWAESMYLGGELERTRVGAFALQIAQFLIKQAVQQHEREQ